jgi:protein N-terminal methyltransferase
MSIVDNGAGAAAQLIALNAPLMYWLSQSLRPGADEATRSMLREHLLPHLAAAGWALLAPLEALWAAMDADVSAACRLHGWAEPLAAGLDANSAAVVHEVVRRAVDGVDDGDGDQELQLAILPNPLAGTEASAVGASGAPSGTASGAASGAVGAVGASAVANGRDGGKDSAQHMYASAREVWEERHLGTESSEDQWYAVSEQYWAGVRADVPGMLGGMGFVHPADVAASLALLDTLRATAEASLPQGVALDCGAGIGRVAASVLLERFEAVELVEPNGAFLAAARNVLPPARVRALHECPLQRFVPPEGSLYAAVWVQWVLIFLTDDDLVSFLSRCARALQPGGWVIVKESVAREANGFYVDRSDASITRTDRHFRRLFDAAGLRVAHAEMQPGLPRVVFPVCMYGLRPA